jgi:hypothetical protein
MEPAFLLAGGVKDGRILLLHLAGRGRSDDNCHSFATPSIKMKWPGYLQARNRRRIVRKIRDVLVFIAGDRKGDQPSGN